MGAPTVVNGESVRGSSAELMLVLAQLLWGFNYTVTKFALTHGFQPLAYSTLRYGGGAVLIVLLVLWRERSLRIHGRLALVLLLTSSITLWLNQLSYSYAIELSSAAAVALIFGTLPMLTALFARIAGLEHLPRAFWIAASISFGGVTMVVLGAGGGASSDVLGSVLALGCAATWAAYSVAVAPLMRWYSPYRVVAIVMLFAFVPLFVTSADQLAGQSYALGFWPWVALGFAVVGALVITHVLWFRAMHLVGPSRAAIFFNLQPLVAVVFAVVLLSERLRWPQLLGGLLIVIGISLSRRERGALGAPAG